MRTSLKWAFVLGFLGFATSFGAHIVAVNLLFYAEKVGIGLTMIDIFPSNEILETWYKKN